jgi:hypothetical protein
VTTLGQCRAAADGFQMNDGSNHICTNHYNKYYLNWKGQGCIDPLCHQPQQQDIHTLTSVPIRCLSVFYNPLPASLIHNTCLKQFETRYHNHANYTPPSPHKRKSLSALLILFLAPLLLLPFSLPFLSICLCLTITITTTITVIR